MLALPPAIAEFGDRGGAVGEETGLEGRVGPGLRDDARAVARADLRLVGLDDQIERGGVDVALLDEHGFERADAQRGFGQLRTVVVIMVVVMTMVVIVVMVMIVIVVVVMHGAMMARAGRPGNV